MESPAQMMIFTLFKALLNEWWLFALIGIAFIVKEILRTKNRRIRALNYAVYLQTPEWNRKRSAVLRRDRYTCQMCGAKANQVHHTRYSRSPGNEPIEWLVAVCEECHLQQHPSKTRDYKKTQ